MEDMSDALVLTDGRLKCSSKAIASDIERYRLRAILNDILVYLQLVRPTMSAASEWSLRPKSPLVSLVVPGVWTF